MKFTIQTFYRDKNGVLQLIKETRCGNLPEALGAWMKAQRNLEVDRIRIEVDKQG